jgi:hypothetical protein
MLRTSFSVLRHKRSKTSQPSRAMPKVANTSPLHSSQGKKAVTEYRWALKRPSLAQTPLALRRPQKPINWTAVPNACETPAEPHYPVRDSVLNALHGSHPVLTGGGLPPLSSFPPGLSGKKVWVIFLGASSWLPSLFLLLFSSASTTIQTTKDNEVALHSPKKQRPLIPYQNFVDSQCLRPSLSCKRPLRAVAWRATVPLSSPGHCPQSSSSPSSDLNDTVDEVF